jgi:hypothetical protein
MKRAVLSLFCTALILPLAACPTSDGGGSPEINPFRQSDWQVEAQVPFVHTTNPGTEDAVVNIASLQVGGRLTGGSNKNFANRGDVIVLFDGPEDVITVEFRRFTAAASEAAADEDYEALSLWAFNANQSSPLPPDQMEAEALCNGEAGWLNNCAIRVYYDGLSQLARAGADIRVTLPPSYNRTLSVITEDNDDDAAYFNRGNVCVDGLSGTADVTLQSGQAFVKLAPEIKPAPQCSDDFIARCEAWPCMPGEGSCMVGEDMVDEGSQAWANECPCVAQVGEFGRIKVDTHDSAAADINIDVPATLWASITAKNEQMGQDSTDPDKHCTIDVSGLPGYELLDGPGNDFPWESRGQINYPGAPAVAGAGYSVQAVSANCEPVPATENPADYVGAANGSDQESTERGNVKVCAGCLAASSCDQLLP